MRPRLSPRDRRALRIVALVALPVLLYAFVLRPFAGHAESAAAAIERERDLLHRERSLLAEAVRYPERILRAEETQRSQRSGRFIGPDPVSSTAMLARYVADLAADHDVRIDRTEARSARDGEAGAELRVSLAATGDIRGVMRWLEALEGGPRIAVVERLAVRVTGSRDGSYAGPEDTAGGVELLDIALDVVGYGPATEALPEEEAR